MKIRPIASVDLPDVLRIQQESALNNGWHEDGYRRLIEAPGGLVLVAYEDSPGPIAGFVAVNVILDHAELLSVAVAHEMRRQGIGKSLLLEACRYMRNAGALSLSLEVRTSNLPAIGLYHSVGFATCRIRKDYYSSPLEDACVMMLSLTAAPVENEHKAG